jgi:hypothetical protein
MNTGTFMRRLVAILLGISVVVVLVLKILTDGLVY